MEYVNATNDVITLPIGKILIIRKKHEKQFLKINQDNTVSELNEEESKYIHDIFNPRKEAVIQSEIIDKGFQKNEHLKQQEAFFKPIIEAIEDVIPQNARENFYRNIETLETKLVSNDSTMQEGHLLGGTYDIRKNEVQEPATFVNYLQELQGNGAIDNAQIEYLKQVIHELIHMSSSEYDKENGMLKTRI